MENASQALIIAGSVLIAVMVITFGIYTIRSASHVGETFESGQSELEVQKFNSKFEIYEKNDNNIYEVVSAINSAYNVNEKNNYDSQSSVTISIRATDDYTDILFENANDVYGISPSVQEHFFNQRLLNPGDSENNKDKEMFYRLNEGNGVDLRKLNELNLRKLNELIRSYSGTTESDQGNRIYKIEFTGNANINDETGLISEIEFELHPTDKL